MCRFALVTVALLALVSSTSRADIALSHLEWQQRTDVCAEDYAKGVAVDSSGCSYITGQTNTNAVGLNNKVDVFLSKYSVSGSLLWSHRIGTPETDIAFGVSADSSGNLYACGSTFGNLFGTNSGSTDGFLVKYSNAGEVVWSRQIGTSGLDECIDVQADTWGNIYVTGRTTGPMGRPEAQNDDLFLNKYDTQGSLLWSRQYGDGDQQFGQSVAVDAAGTAYIGGLTFGLNGGDATLTKVDKDGNTIWTRQFGTSAYEFQCSVSLDASGDPYVAGGTYGNLAGQNAGGIDGFVIKFDTSGNQVWSSQYGGTSNDRFYDIAVDASGNAYATGYTTLVMYDSGGNMQWEEDLTAPRNSFGMSVAVDNCGHAFVAGSGSWDYVAPGAFIAKFDVPEPATLSLLALSALAMLRRRK